MKRIVLVLSVAILLIWCFNAGLEVGLRNKPYFNGSEYTEVECNDITPREGGVACSIFMDAEDSNVRIFKGEGSKDDTYTSFGQK